MEEEFSEEVGGKGASSAPRSAEASGSRSVVLMSKLLIKLDVFPWSSTGK